MNPRRSDLRLALLLLVVVVALNLGLFLSGRSRGQVDWLRETEGQAGFVYATDASGKDFKQRIHLMNGHWEKVEVGLRADGVLVWRPAPPQ